MQEYQLENVVNRHSAKPKDFWIPNKEHLERIEVGDFTQMIFIPKEEGLISERMWVEVNSIENINGERIYHGTLNNIPYNLNMKLGDEVTFKDENIMNMMYEKNGELAFNIFGD